MQCKIQTWIDFHITIIFLGWRGSWWRFEDAIPEADEDEDAEHVTLNFGEKKKKMVMLQKKCHWQKLRMTLSLKNKT